MSSVFVFRENFSEVIQLTKVLMRLFGKCACMCLCYI